MTIEFVTSMADKSCRFRDKISLQRCDVEVLRLVPHSSIGNRSNRFRHSNKRNCLSRNSFRSGIPAAGPWAIDTN